MSALKKVKNHPLNGLLFVGLFACASLYIATMPWIKQIGISSLVIAIILGIVYGNTLRNQLPAEWTPGIQFAAKKLLRLAIILYGFRISFQEIASIGIEGVTLDIIIVSSTLFLGSYIGMRLFKLDHHLAILISAGAAICGAAAVLAVEDVLKSEPYKASVAVGTVVLFGIIAMLLYPILQKIGLFGFTDIQFGLFSGASIHEVAQVVVAGANISPAASNTAVIVKMTRVLLLVPVLLLLPFYQGQNPTSGSPKQKVVIPWFAVFFILVIGINSLLSFPKDLINLINSIDAFLLTMAMAAIGIETNLKKIKHVGAKPFYLAICLTIWLAGCSYIVIKLFD